MRFHCTVLNEKVPYRRICQNITFKNELRVTNYIYLGSCGYHRVWCETNLGLWPAIQLLQVTLKCIREIGLTLEEGLKLEGRLNKEESWAQAYLKQPGPSLNAFL